MKSFRLSTAEKKQAQQLRKAKKNARGKQWQAVKASD